LRRRPAVARGRTWNRRLAPLPGRSRRRGTAQQIRTIVPEVRVAAVRASDSNITVTLPATTTAFEAAIFSRAPAATSKSATWTSVIGQGGRPVAQIVALSSTTRLHRPRQRWPRTRPRCSKPSKPGPRRRHHARDSKLVQQDGSRFSRATTIASPCRPSKPRWGWLSPTSPPSRPRFACSGRRRTTACGGAVRRVITQRNIDNGSLVTSGSTFMYTLMHPTSSAPRCSSRRTRPSESGRASMQWSASPRFRIAASRQGHAHRECAAAWQPDAADRDRRSQSGRCAESRNLLHRRTVYSAQDAIDDRPGRCRGIDQNGVHVAVVENAPPICRRSPSHVIRHRGGVHDGVKPGDQVILNPMVNLAKQQGSGAVGEQDSDQLDPRGGGNCDAAPAVCNGRPAAGL